MSTTWILLLIFVDLGYQQYVPVQQVQLELRQFNEHDLDLTQVREKSQNKLRKIKLPVVNLPVRQVTLNQSVCDGSLCSSRHYQ